MNDNNEQEAVRLSPYNPKCMLRVAVTCGLYGINAPKGLQQEVFVTSVFTKFVLSQQRSVESIGHLEMTELAYKAYRLHHEHPSISEEFGLVRALLIGDSARVTAILKFADKQLKTKVVTSRTAAEQVLVPAPATVHDKQPAVNWASME